jgi:hypothetical protein
LNWWYLDVAPLFKKGIQRSWECVSIKHSCLDLVHYSFNIFCSAEVKILSLSLKQSCSNFGITSLTGLRMFPVFSFLFSFYKELQYIRLFLGFRNETRIFRYRPFHCSNWHAAELYKNKTRLAAVQCSVVCSISVALSSAPPPPSCCTIINFYIPSSIFQRERERET